MLDSKKEALKDLMSMVKGEKAKRIKVIVEGDSVEEVKKGLEEAEEKMDQIPEAMMEPEKEEKSMDLEGLLKSLSPAQKKELMKKLEK